MPSYEWTGVDAFRDARNDRIIAPGEVVDLQAAIGDPQPDMVSVDVEDSDAPDDDSEDTDGPPFDPAEYSVAALRDELAEGELTVSECDALLAAESNGKNRKTALTAIETARPE